MGESKNPDYPTADPTAPGGMSQKALVAEMVEKHGWDKAEARVMRWPDQIDAVIEGRRQREIEARQDSDDLESLLAELEEAEPIVVVNGDPVPDAEVDRAMAQITGSLLIPDPHTYDYIFNGHAGAGPSGAERWMHCTASLQASREFLETLTPNQQRAFAQGSEAARQGTTAHAAAEVEARVILGEIDASEAENTLLELAVVPDTAGEAYDDEMAEYISEYVDLIRTYVNDRGAENVRIEQRVVAAIPLSGMFADDVYEIAGFGDTVVLPTPEEPALVVADLKYGAGKDVSVEENPQVRIYALGALDLLADDEGRLPEWLKDVVYHIAQPRLGGMKTWSEPLDDLLDWRDNVLSPALTKALHGREAGAVFAPSETACQWCPARGTCAALAEDRVAAAADLFDTIVEAEFEDGPGAFPETTSLSDARLGALLEQAIGLEKITKDLKAEAERRLFRGGQIPGFKLVNYQPPRKWSDDAETVLGEVGTPVFVKKMMTPTQAMKALGDQAKVIEPYVVKPDKRPVVARADDRRSEWEGKPPEDMFEDLSNE